MSLARIMDSVTLWLPAVFFVAIYCSYCCILYLIYSLVCVVVNVCFIYGLPRGSHCCLLSVVLSQ